MNWDSVDDLNISIVDSDKESQLVVVVAGDIMLSFFLTRNLNTLNNKTKNPPLKSKKTSAQKQTNHQQLPQ